MGLKITELGHLSKNLKQSLKTTLTRKSSVFDVTQPEQVESTIIRPQDVGLIVQLEVADWKDNLLVWCLCEAFKLLLGAQRNSSHLWLSVCLGQRRPEVHFGNKYHYILLWQEFCAFQWRWNCESHTLSDSCESLYGWQVLHCSLLAWSSFWCLCSCL